MNKKTYQTPSVTVEKIELIQMLAESVTSINGMGYGGGGNGPARSREQGDFMDDDEE